MTTLESYVCGEWKAGVEDPRPLENPATGERLAEVRSGGIDFAAVVAHARDHGGPALRAMTFAERGAILRELSSVLHEKRDELIALSTSNGGNTRGDAKFDIDGATGTLAFYGGLGEKLGSARFLPDGDGAKLSRAARFFGQHILVPRSGVAVHINAFNFPTWGMGEKMACALLAGVPVIEKAGTPSAILAHRMAQLVVDSGLLPEGTFQFVAGGVGDLLDHLGPQDCLAFTGSSGTGAKLKANANLIDRNVRVNIEADSLNAAVLGPDVDNDNEVYNLFLANVVYDMRQKAGQKCTAVRRILVPEHKVAEVRAELVERLTAVKVGDPADESVQMGPVASAAQLADVRAGIDRLAAAGEVCCGGSQAVAESGYFVAPTLVYVSDATSDVVHADEVFGPVATLMPYSGDAEALVDHVNRGGGSLVASVYSNDKDWSEQVLLGLAPWHGRVWLASDKVAEQTLAPGMVLPQMIHGGPGRAGGGEELGALRGLSFYMQRTALQGDRGFLSRRFGNESE